MRFVCSTWERIVRRLCEYAPLPPTWSHLAATLLANSLDKQGRGIQDWACLSLMLIHGPILILLGLLYLSQAYGLNICLKRGVQFKFPWLYIQIQIKLLFFQLIKKETDIFSCAWLPSCVYYYIDIVFSLYDTHLSLLTTYSSPQYKMLNWPTRTLNSKSLPLSPHKILPTMIEYITYLPPWSTKPVFNKVELTYAFGVHYVISWNLQKNNFMKITNNKD